MLAHDLSSVGCLRKRRTWPRRGCGSASAPPQPRARTRRELEPASGVYMPSLWGNIETCHRNIIMCNQM
eukprot:366272-Chlamydomonas_euryale.AAC.6